MNIIIWAPSLLHFKGLSMRNLQYEMRIGQKSHNKVTKAVYVWFEFLWIRRYNLHSCFPANKFMLILLPNILGIEIQGS